jgi:hypothetical protein
MEHLKTALKWALPSAKFAYKMLAISAEVICRHSFGRRYAINLLASYVFCLAVTGLMRFGAMELRPDLLKSYLLIYAILMIYHLACMWRHQPNLHSHSSGQSWGIWEQLHFNSTAVKILVEPLLFVLTGAALLEANIILSLWLQFGGLCLFYKGLSAHWNFRNRVMDSMDARLEGERIGGGVRQQTAPRGGRTQGANPVTMAEPAQQPADAGPQMYNNLDPALRRLIGAPNQTQPNPAPATQPGTPLVIVRNRRRQHP